MRKTVSVVEVRIWGKTVGAVALDPKLGYYAFEYDPEFIASGIELAPFSMPLAKAKEPFVFTELPELSFHRLPAMLADALPDDFGNSLIDVWMAMNERDKVRVSPLDRLAYMDSRGMGALEFGPVREKPGAMENTAIKLYRIVEAARGVLPGHLGEGAIDKSSLRQLIQTGTSAGGASAKAVIAWNPETGEMRSGQFDVDSGFEHWLLKFDGMGSDKGLGGTQDYGRVEYAYYRMATAAGIEMAPCRLEEENGRAHFMTRRFDRDGNRKHHLQTLCAMSHLDYNLKDGNDYNQLFLTMKKLRLGYSAMEQGFRRMAFNIMTANCDDHSKNFSFLLREGEEWQLAPAYDMTHNHNPANRHLMSVNGKFSDISAVDLLTVADRFGIGTARRIIEQVRDAVSSWPDFAKESKANQDAIKHIRAHHRLLR